ncbi:hypothetical protein AHMF7605_03065 [Adhaeribacter arboris]|uniref:Uncharacterized protein n=1 Tax=Adhaeribacter arboris TaxID=2072846 RepID=A0A2T2YAN7_9BACT|nr:hypothetical protein [Adhaeribacter arboris]PSR52577.1 hypothetical protein AHMF7605_03065 [Adhaeribacter arboris]
MKQFLTLFFLFSLLVSCNQEVKNKKINKKEAEKRNKVQRPNISYSNKISTGKWYFLPYTDSTIINKSIFKYSQSCASFAYMISYDSSNPDSIFFKGYHEETMMPLIKRSDTIFWAGDTIQHWEITFNNDFSSLQFQEYMDKSYAHKADPRLFQFAKSVKEIQNLAIYFNKFILAGAYKNEQSKVRFTDKFEVVGIDNAATYELVIDFWEMVPQMDLINLFDKKGELLKQLNWEYDGEILKLRNVRQIYDKDGDLDRGVAEDIIYELKKIK